MQICNEHIRSSRLRPVLIVLGALVLLTQAACSTTGRGPSAVSRQSDTGLSRQQTREADAQFERALAALQARQHDEAREIFLALAAAHPDLSGPLTNLGILTAQGRDAAQALQHFTRAVEANPRNAVAFNWLGILYREQGDYGRAEQSYLRAIALDDRYAVAHRNLGVLYDAYLRRPELAIAQYQRYLTLTNSEELIVQVWIKELQAENITAAAAVGHTP
jgi:tetratricopeptide (TPR) repeat protein